MQEVRVFYVSSTKEQNEEIKMSRTLTQMEGEMNSVLVLRCMARCVSMKHDGI